MKGINYRGRTWLRAEDGVSVQRDIDRSYTLEIYGEIDSPGNKTRKNIALGIDAILTDFEKRGTKELKIKVEGDVQGLVELTARENDKYREAWKAISKSREA